MPRNLCTPRPLHPTRQLRFSEPPPRRGAVATRQVARQRARANRVTLVLAGLSIVCATAEALWMSTPLV
ncbi:MAG: hypothetical protein IPJ08_12490 [Burkholderiales bacterium]|nr:hypothetical protein [Burkholderiales bacterium]